ncbi:hypothetical protein [Castellaniella defragrans]|jgi:hypothetical protein|nr:hypothetical protein [Castellaniella defragrans]
MSDKLTEIRSTKAIRPGAAERPALSESRGRMPITEQEWLE